MRLRFHDNAYSYKVSLPYGCRRSSLVCLLHYSSECGLVKYPLLLHINLNLNKVLSLVSVASVSIWILFCDFVVHTILRLKCSAV
jgi:hypothetical protein